MVAEAEALKEVALVVVGAAVVVVGAAVVVVGAAVVVVVGALLELELAWGAAEELASELSMPETEETSMAEEAWLAEAPETATRAATVATA